MKALFFVLALTFVCSSLAVTLQGGYQKHENVEQFMALDPSVKELLDFGREQFVQQAAKQSNSITSSDFTIQKINSISTQVVAGMNYKFNVDLVNSQGQVYNVDLVVFSQVWTDTKELISFTINK